jgi:hypothetical protein
MFKKICLTALTVASLMLGAGIAASPANAQVFFGLGMGNRYGGGYYGDPYYGGGPYYGGWHHRYYSMGCGWVKVRRHHHWVNVRRCPY